MALGDALSRCAIIYSSANENDVYFVWTCHHSVYDGWSMGLVMKDLALAYRKSALELAQPFNRFIKHISEIDNDVSKEFWTTQLNGFSTRPLRSTSPLNRISKATYCKISIPERSCMQFTKASIVHAAWLAVLAHNAESNEAVSKVTVLGRNCPVAGIEDVAGPTIGSIPLRVKIDWLASPKNLLADVQTRLKEMIPREQDGFENISQVNLETAAACAFAMPIVVHPAEQSLNGLGSEIGLQQLFVSAHTAAPVSFALDCSMNTEGVEVYASYDDCVYEQSFVETMLRQLERALNWLSISAGDARLSDLQWDSGVVVNESMHTRSLEGNLRFEV